MCVRESSSHFQELKMESYRIKYYAQERFKDITSLIKIAPICTCASFVALAGAIYFVALPVFLTLSTVVILDYLDKTYVISRQSPPWSMSFWRLFYDMYYLRTWQPSQELNELDQESQESPDKYTEDERELIKRGKQIQEGFERKILKERKAYEEDLRPVVLFLRAKADHNGALRNQDQAITINGNNDEGIKKLKEKYKIAIIDHITHVNQIKEGLEKITNPIQQVWIFAHGSPTSMELEDNNKIRNREIDDLAPLLQQKLSADAHVILYSCSTGKKIVAGENIATRFSKILPGRTIWAPNIPTGIVTCNLDTDSSLKVKFWKYKNRREYLKEKIWNICRLQPFKKIEVIVNATTQTKNGIQCLSAA